MVKFVECKGSLYLCGDLARRVKRVQMKRNLNGYSYGTRSTKKRFSAGTRRICSFRVHWVSSRIQFVI